MSVAKPIVAFDLPEHWVTANDAAAYAATNDELDFAREIATLMDDPDRQPPELLARTPERKCFIDHARDCRPDS